VASGECRRHIAQDQGPDPDERHTEHRHRAVGDGVELVRENLTCRSGSASHGQEDRGGGGKAGKEPVNRSTDSGHGLEPGSMNLDVSET
jgi:hypothetical protein